MIMPAIPADSPDVMIYVILILYVAPVIAFIVGFWLLTVRSQNTEYRSQSCVFCFALFCAVAGVLIHNTIDFAIFEPGVLTAFWAVIASLIALDSNRNPQRQFVLKTPAIAKITVAAAALALTCIYFNYALIPVAKSTAKIKLAHKAISYGRLEQACYLFSAAAKDDSLSPAALFLNSRTYLQEFFRTEPKQKKLLLRSEKCLLGAIKRNQADFKNLERLTEVYTLLAENSKQQVKTNWLNKAFDSIKYAVKRYPGCGRLRIELAKIAEQLGKTDTALEQYQKAIEIEDSYRSQFRIMYPDREIFSRLGEEKYQSAKQRIKSLSQQTTP
jgi:tetratricopeptide (TPR) repeat protein